MPSSSQYGPSADEDFDIVSDGMKFESFGEPEVIAEPQVVVKTVPKLTPRPIEVQPRPMKPIASKPLPLQKPVSNPVVKPAEQAIAVRITPKPTPTKPISVSKPMVTSVSVRRTVPINKVAPPYKPATPTPLPKPVVRSANATPVLNLPPLPKLDNLGLPRTTPVRARQPIVKKEFTPPPKPAKKLTKIDAKTATIKSIKSKKGTSHNIWHIIAEAVLAVVVVAVGFYAWNLRSDNKKLHTQVSQETNSSGSQKVTAADEAQELIMKVGRLTDLPSGETPTIANVTDVTAARKQSHFFDQAENGDKVLMYVKSGEAILYRPSTDKVVEVAPMNFTSSTAGASSATPSTTAPTTTQP